MNHLTSRRREKRGTEETVTLPDYQNPQHEPGNEKRLMLVFLVAFILMLALLPLQKKYFPQQVAPQQPAQPAQPQPAPTPAVSTAAPAVVIRPAQ